MVIDNVKIFIYEFCRQYHFDQMPEDVRARYDKLAKNKDFAGNMKFWDRDLDGKPLPTLDPAKLEDLYKLFQAVFENMAQKENDFKENTAVHGFFKEWFGDDKVFNQPEPVNGVEARITDFVSKVLDAGFNNQLALILKRYNIVPADFDYDQFVADIKAKKYLKNPELRDTLFDIINYAQDYSNPAYGIEYWPSGLTQYDVTTPVTVGGVSAITSPDTSTWFTTRYNASFRAAAPELLKKLVDSPKIFKAFQEYDYKKTISKNVTKAIEATNYADDKSDDFLQPVYQDEKRLIQRIDDKLNKIKENQIDPWTNVLRGTRRFFTPYARTVIEAISKVKNKDGKPLKPTDGLKGILDNKDAIAKKLNGVSPTAKKHFDWFAKQMAVYSEKMPKAFEGALRNPRQMRAIISRIINDAVKGGNIDEAKTAMEIISTMKYGIMHSRVVDAATKEDFTLLSDKGLSWNKYEAPRIFTKAADKTAKIAILAVGRGVVAIRNKWMRDNTKLKGKFKDGTDTDKSYKDWQAKNKQDKARHETHSAIVLSELANGNGESGFIIDNTTIDDAKTNILPSLVGQPKYDELLHDIQRYEYAAKEKTDVENWEKNHPDKYKELTAYWDMLESFWKSHQFTFAADKMKNKFLANYKTGASKAQAVAKTYLDNYQMAA